MSDPIKRTEITHIDEVSRKATSTVQWLLENRNKEGSITHPITHNNKLTMFMGGEEGFADIADQIAKAEGSIDICCWGFDPGMELVRGDSAIWPRGETYGDLLIAAGKRGVQVRLLVWHDPVVVLVKNPRNMPGHTHGEWPWIDCFYGKTFAETISAARSMAMLRNFNKTRVRPTSPPGEPMIYVRRELFPVSEAQIPFLARTEYCHSWYAAAYAKNLKNIEFRMRHSSAQAIASSLDAEQAQSELPSPTGIEREGLIHGGSHHQKPILIDFDYKEGNKAVGYVIGLNSLTDYWDSNSHLVEDLRREPGGEREAAERTQGESDAAGFKTFKPYHDYACRLDGGGALIALYNNFIAAWNHSAADCIRPPWDSSCPGAPSALLRHAEPGDSTVQIVRTQPEEQDCTIREAYCQATDIATLGAGYLYIENQYFQYEAWTQRLQRKREAYVAAWRRGCAKIGKAMRDMPIMYVFIVIPEPEMESMIPRTYDTLAVLGQQDGMTGQNKMINDMNNQGQQYDMMGTPVSGTVAVGGVVENANNIDKPDIKLLESKFGLKVSVAMLNTCGLVNGRWRYREVYIHSKLMLIDDVFMTIGSANLSLRSMAVDSELNLATADPGLVRALRRRVWQQHSGGLVDGKNGSKAEIAKAFKDWNKSMLSNRICKFSKSQSADDRKMTGFLLPFTDTRSSTTSLS